MTGISIVPDRCLCSPVVVVMDDLGMAVEKDFKEFFYNFDADLKNIKI